MLGLDDIRGFQRVPSMISSDGVPIRNVVAKGKKTKDEVERSVASLDFQVVEHFKPFIAGGLKMIPLAVWHW